MSRWTVLVTAFIVVTLFLVSCSGGGSNPVGNNVNDNLTGDKTPQATNSHNVLWGYHDLYFDFANGTVESVVNRSVMFTANVTQFINSSSGLTFDNIVVTGTGPVNVTLDVGVIHPLADPVYDGYDVRAHFIGDGSATLAHNGLDYAEFGTDQTVNDPDGYSRWFNPTEFGVPGLLGYTPGSLATADYEGSATLNPYMFYADDLGLADDAAEFVMAGVGNNVFSNGTTNERSWDIDFVLPDPGVAYGYAIVANWIDEVTHPANTTEVVVASVDVTDNIYFVDGTDNGGDLILDITLAGYGAQPSTVYIESNVFSTVQTPLLVSTGSGDTYSTYHAEIPTDNVTSTGGNEFWVIAEYGASDYTNEFSVPNDADTDPLTAYFRYSLFVADTPYCSAVTVDSIAGLATATQAYPQAYTGVTITGSGFEGTSATVLFDGTTDINATNVVVVDLNTITCDVDFTGASIGSFFDVFVTNECGNDGTAVGLVEIICPAVTVTAVGNHGLFGNFLVQRSFTGLTITGTGFFGACTVSFTGPSTIAATSVVVNSPTQITCNANFTTGNLGNYNVSVTNSCPNNGIGTNLLTLINQIVSVAPVNQNVAVAGQTVKDIACDPAIIGRGQIGYDFTAGNNASFYRTYTGNWVIPSINFTTFNNEGVGALDLSTWGGFDAGEYTAGGNPPLAYPVFCFTQYLAASSGAFYGFSNGTARMYDCSNQAAFTTIFYFGDNPATSQAGWGSVTNLNVTAGWWGINAPFRNGAGNTGVVMTDFRAMTCPPAGGLTQMQAIEVVAPGTATLENWNMPPAANPPTLTLGTNISNLYNPIDISTDATGVLWILAIDSGGLPNVYTMTAGHVLTGASEGIPAATISGAVIAADVAIAPAIDEFHVLHAGAGGAVTRFIP